MTGRVFFLISWCLIIFKGTAFAASTQVKVGPDDTVYKIAYEQGILTKALIDANGLTFPYTLTQGQVLIIPAPEPTRQNDNMTIPSSTTETVNVAFMPSSQEIATSSLAPLPLVNTQKPAAPTISPKPEATLFNKPGLLAPLPSDKNALPSAGKSALPSDLAKEIANEKEIQKGKASLSDSSPPPLMGNLAEKTSGASQPPTPIAEQEKKPKKEKKTEKKEEEKGEDAKIKETLFIWPVEGKVIGKFRTDGKNDGINIKVAEGTPVKASAEGDVMYAGSELKGFGNLLLIKHKDGWMTAYAHNSELLVKKGAAVKQGQHIAKSGKPDGAKEAQLHFEVRKGKQPVDPLTKLRAL